MNDDKEFGLGSLIGRDLPPGFDSLAFDSLLKGVSEGIEKTFDEPEALPVSVASRSSLAKSESAGAEGVQGLLGAGGLAEVYLYEDEDFGRPVALKTLAPDRINDPIVHQVFHQEYRTLGQLEHPGTPSVFNAGELPDGRPFYTMQLVEGRPLFKVIRDTTRDGAGLRTLVELVIRMTETISFAHSRGFLHGDLKSPNVMVGEDGEVIVIDWGLAQSLNGSLRARSGTPAWMAPEQATGDHDRIGVWTEVYSLGAILFEVLTTRPPHDRPEIDSTLDNEAKKEAMVRFAATDPTPALPASPSIPAELASICLRALSTEPDDRGTVIDLRTDLQNWMFNQPVTAHEYSLTERATRWAVAHKFSLSALAGVIIAGLAITALWQRATNAELTVDLKEEQRSNAIALANERHQSAIDSWKESFQIITEELQDIGGAMPARKRIVQRALTRLKELSDSALTDSGGKLAALKAQTLRAGLIRVELGELRQAQSEFQEVLKRISDLGVNPQQEGELFAVHADALTGMLECELALNGPKAAEAPLKDLERLSESREDVVKDYHSALAADNLDVYRARVMRRLRPQSKEETAKSVLVPALERNAIALENLKTGVMKVPDRLSDLTERRKSGKGSSRRLAIGQLKFSRALILDELLFSSTSPQEAVRYAKQSSEVCVELASQHPHNKDYASALAGSLVNLGRFQKDAGSLDEARDSLKDALSQATNLVEQYPLEANLRDLRETAEHNLGSIYTALGSHNEAKQIFERQISAAGEPNEETPSNDIQYLAISYVSLANAELAMGNRSAAFIAFMRAQELRILVATKDASDLANISQAAVLSDGIGEACTNMEAWVNAAQQLEKLQRCVLAHVDDGRLSDPMAIGRPAFVVMGLIQALSDLAPVSQDAVSAGRTVLDLAEELTAHVKGIPPENLEQLRDAIKAARASVEVFATK